MLIEEWKFYKGDNQTSKDYENNIWVSNYGYVAKFTKDEAKQHLSDVLEEDRETFKFKECSDKEKAFMRVRNFVPGNRKSSDYQICLHVQETGEDLHRMVAKTFVPNPDGKAKAYHKDSNSYNNSKTNLEWRD